MTNPTPHGQVPEALRLAEALERPGYGWHTTPAQCAAVLRRLHAENVTLQQGYDAARMEIEGLRDRVQELGAMLRGNCNRRIVELEAQLEAIGAGGVEPLRRRECLHQIAAPADPLDTPLPCDLTAGGVTIGKGCPLRTVQLRLQVQADANALLLLRAKEGGA